MDKVTLMPKSPQSPSSWGVFSSDRLDEMQSFFVDQGFAILRGLWSQSEIDQFERDCVSIQEGVMTGTLPDRYGKRDEMNLGGLHSSVAPSHLYHVTELSEPVNNAVHHPALVQSIQTWLDNGWLMGEKGVWGVVFQDARPNPESGYSRLGWHSDWQTGPHDTRWPGVSFTIHIDGTSPSNGFLRVIPGSHRWATPAPYGNVNNVEVPHDARPTGGHTDVAPPYEMPKYFERLPGEIGVYCERGDVLFHDSYIWHSAARGTDDSTKRRHIRGVWRSGANVHENNAARIILPVAQ